MRTGVGAWVLAILPSVAPVLPDDITFAWADQYSDMPLLSLGIVAAGVRVRQAEARAERGFWILAATCLVWWMSVRLLYIAVPTGRWGTGWDVTIDVQYLLGYLCLALAFEFPPDRSADHGLADGTTRAESVGTFVFAFMLVTYLVLAPSVFTPRLYDSWASSLLLYAAIDLYLLVRVLILLRTMGEPFAWRSAYSWLSVAVGLWLLTDLIEGLMYLEILPYVWSGTPLDVLWHGPSLCVLAAVRARECSVDASARGPKPGLVSLRQGT